MDVFHEKLTKIKEIRYRMKKIMFNDRYGLTQAVIEGRKTMTRRLINLNSTSDVQVRIFAGYVQIIGRSGNVCAEKKLPYKVGEIVAVAQSYRTILNELENPDNYYCIEHWEQDNGKRAEYAGMIYDPGYGNKLFTRADAMPHQIRIAGIKCERLQDISDEDCFKEGINASNSHEIGYGIPWVYEFAGSKMVYYTPREAFASLIDKVSGRGTWARNPWVVVYEFELVK